MSSSEEELLGPAGEDMEEPVFGGHVGREESGSDEQGDSGEDSPDEYDDSDEDEEDENEDEDEAGLRRKMSELRGMMGSLYPFEAPSSFNSVDMVLAKEDVELEQLLDLDDFLADLRRTKVKLIEFSYVDALGSVWSGVRAGRSQQAHRGRGVVYSLQRPEILRKLVDYIAAEKYPSHIEPDRAKRYAHLAYESIQTEVLKEALINDSSLLDRFFEFLDMTGEMDPLRCAYFSRIVEILFERFPKELINYLKKKKDIVGKFVWHINNQYIVESLFRLIDSQNSHPWLHEEDLIPLLMIKMAETTDPEIQDKTSQTFVEILDLFVPYPYSVLTTQMFHTAIVAEQWEQFTLADLNDHRRVQNGLNVAIGILSLSYDGIMCDETPIFMKKVVSHLGVFQNFLKNAPSNECFEMTYGPLQPPFGFLRLKILEFLSALLNSKYPEVLEITLQPELLEILVDMFFKYPWNNTMHFYIQHNITVMLQFESDSTGERAARILLDHCKFLDRVCDAFENQTDRTVGYLGHLVGICTEILRLSSDRPALKEFLAASDSWKRMCSGKLKEAMDRHSKPLVERPQGDDVFSSAIDDGGEFEMRQEEGSDEDLDFDGRE